MLVSVMFEDNMSIVLPMEINEELRFDTFVTLALSHFQRTDTADKYTILHEGKAWTQIELAKVEGTLKSLGIKENSLIMLSRRVELNVPSSSSSSAPIGNPLANLVKSIVVPNNPQERLMECQVAKLATKIFYSLRDPAERAKLNKQNPVLVAMYEKRTNDLGGFIMEFREIFMADRIKKMRALANPDSHEAQAIIEELIRNERLDRAANEAMEEIPEAFVQVQMLYFRTTLNGHDVTAFVDTGAQTTIISKSAAERCNLMKMMDTRCHIVLNGVGGAKRSLGKVFKCDMIVEDHHFPVSLTVAPDDSINMDLIFGLDLLLRHHAIIDLRKRVIVFNGEATAQLLSEAEAEKLKVFRESVYGEMNFNPEAPSSSTVGGSGNESKKDDDHPMEH